MKNENANEMDLNNYWDETKLDTEFVNKLTIIDRNATIIGIDEVTIVDNDGQEKVLPEITLDFYELKVIKKFLLNRTSKDNLSQGFGTTLVTKIIGKRCYPVTKKFGNNYGVVLNPIVSTGVERE